MAIRTLIVEHRPRLQSANFFIQLALSGGGIDVDQDGGIAVVLRENSVEIVVRKKDSSQVGGGGVTIKDQNSVSTSYNNNNNTGWVISTAGHFHVLANSLSSLVVKDGYLSFRVNTNVRSFGVEWLNQVDCDRFKAMQVVKVQPLVVANKAYSIRCSNCTRDLGKARWARIFELPSDNFDSGEWFCHKTINFDVAAPKEDELFYGYYYAVVNARVFDEGTVIRRGTSQLVHCKRCLQFLGQETEGGETGGGGGCGHGGGGGGLSVPNGGQVEKVSRGFKLWNENLKIVEIDGLANGNPPNSDFILQSHHSMMGNFQNLIRKIVHDFEYVDKFTSLLPSMHKILVKSFRTDSSREVPSVYLLVQVMEMSLDMFKGMGLDGEQKLKKQQAMKLLFSFVDTAAKDDQLLKYWQNDQNVHPLQVSPKMFDVVLAGLRENALLIPPVYRHSYGFELSFLFGDEAIGGD